MADEAPPQTIEMDAITLIDGYFSLWNESSDTEREARAREVWADDGVYVDPLSHTEGPQAFSEMVGAIREQSGDIAVRRSSPIDCHHDVARFHWEIQGPDGTVAVTGIDVAHIQDGRLCRMTGFMGERPVDES